MTLQTLHEQIELRFATGLVINTHLINRALKEFARRSRFLNKTAYLKPESDGVTYVMPDDYIEIRKVFHNSTGTPPLEGEEYPELGKRVSRYVSGQEPSRRRTKDHLVYMVSADKKSIRVGRITTGNLEPTEGFFVFTYVCYDDVLTDLADTARMPDEYEDAIVARVSEQMYLDRGESDKSRAQYTKWADMVRDAKKEALRRNGADGFRPQNHFI
jgi:hypothetical protein